VARVNAVETRKLQLTVDIVTDHVIGAIAALGIHGTNKSDVAGSILRMWLWDNQTKLRENGVVFATPRAHRRSVKTPRR